MPALDFHGLRDPRIVLSCEGELAVGGSQFSSANVTNEGVSTNLWDGFR